MRLLVVAAWLSLTVAACGGGVASTPSAEPTPTPHGTIVYGIVFTANPSPTPSPTVSPTPVPILHPPPYTVAIEAGHGGLENWGGSGRDTDGNRWIEKDLTLAVALRVGEMLSSSGYNALQIRSDDSTLTPWNWYDYRGSLIREAQARVDAANAANADVYLAIHFNGWGDASQHGTEMYCNPDRSFANESCQFASFLQTALVKHIREAGYDIRDRGVKNDADVNGDPNNEHSFALGTNANFSPTLMPGVIAETLFLSNPEDLAFLRRPDAIDVIAGGYVEGIEAYFAWLNGG